MGVGAHLSTGQRKQWRVTRSGEIDGVSWCAFVSRRSMLSVAHPTGALVRTKGRKWESRRGMQSTGLHEHAESMHETAPTLW